MPRKPSNPVAPAVRRVRDGDLRNTSGPVAPGMKREIDWAKRNKPKVADPGGLNHRPKR